MIKAMTPEEWLGYVDAGLDGYGLQFAQPMGKLFFMTTAGMFVKRELVNEIEGYCFAHDLAVTTKENKGLLDSMFVFDVMGPMDKLLTFKEVLKNWSEIQQSEIKEY